MSHTTAKNELKELPGIPPYAEIYDIMAVGYPAYVPGSQSLHKLEEMIHNDGFQQEKYQTDQENRALPKTRRKSR